MTELTREDLRKWSAELQGWTYRCYENQHYGCDPCYWDTGEDGIPESQWAPDSPDAPAWQILAVLRKMRELGFVVRIFNYLDGLWEVYFMSKRSMTQQLGHTFGNEFGNTTLQAAHAAWSAGREK